VVTLIQRIAEDPLFVVETIRQLIEVVRNLSAEVLGQIVDSAITQFQQKQDRNNPYEQTEQLYGEYESGWYIGYAAGFLAKTAVGASATKALKSTKTVQKITRTLGKTRVGGLLLRAKSLSDAAQTRVAGVLLRAGDSALSGVLARASTVGATYRLWQLQRQLDAGNGYTDLEQRRVSAFLERADRETARQFARLDPAVRTRILGPDVCRAGPSVLAQCLDIDERTAVTASVRAQDAIERVNLDRFDGIETEQEAYAAFWDRLDDADTLTREALYKLAADPEATPNVVRFVLDADDDEVFDRLRQYAEKNPDFEVPAYILQAGSAAADVPYAGLTDEFGTTSINPTAGAFSAVNSKYVRVNGVQRVGDGQIGTEAYYMDNGGLYFQRQAAQQVGEDDLGELSSNQLGNIVEQQVAVDVAERKGYDVLYTDDGANGIDMIARDGEDIVIIESKYSGSDDRVTAGDFKSKRQGAKQMTDEWVQTAFTGELQAIREQVDAGTLAEIDDAISDGDYRKEAVSVTPHSSEKLIGNSPELSDRIDELNIVKLGETRGLTEE
jgi:hypothetical protein